MLERKVEKKYLRSIMRDLASATAALWDTDENGFIVNPCQNCKLPWHDCKCENGGWPIKNDLMVEDDFMWEDEHGQPHILTDEELFLFISKIEHSGKYTFSFWINDKPCSLFGNQFVSRYYCSQFLKDHCCMSRYEVYSKWAEWERVHWTPGLKKAIKAGMDFKVLPPQTPTDEHITS